MGTETPHRSTIQPSSEVAPSSRQPWRRSSSPTSSTKRPSRAPTRCAVSVAASMSSSVDRAASVEAAAAAPVRRGRLSPQRLPSGEERSRPMATCTRTAISRLALHLRSRPAVGWPPTGCRCSSSGPRPSPLASSQSQWTSESPPCPRQCRLTASPRTESRRSRSSTASISNVTGHPVPASNVRRRSPARMCPYSPPRSRKPHDDRVSLGTGDGVDQPGVPRARRTEGIADAAEARRLRCGGAVHDALRSTLRSWPPRAVAHRVTVDGELPRRASTIVPVTWPAWSKWAPFKNGTTPVGCGLGAMIASNSRSSSSPPGSE